MSGGQLVRCSPQALTQLAAALHTFTEGIEEAAGALGHALATASEHLQQLPEAAEGVEALLTTITPAPALAHATRARVLALRERLSAYLQPPAAGATSSPLGASADFGGAGEELMPNGLEDLFEPEPEEAGAGGAGLMPNGLQDLFGQVTSNIAPGGCIQPNGLEDLVESEPGNPGAGGGSLMPNGLEDLFEPEPPPKSLPPHLHREWRNGRHIPRGDGRVYLPPGDWDRLNAKDMPAPPEGFYLIGLHGNPLGATGAFGALTTAEVAALVRADPRYRDGQGVMLFSCSTGHFTAARDAHGQTHWGFAKEVSDLLRAPVLAPSANVVLSPGGEVTFRHNQQSVNGMFQPIGMHHRREWDRPPGTPTS